MGTRERRQREVAEREKRFVDRARELIRVEGLLNLQMSRVADGCDYAVGTLYQHFSSKEDLLLAVTTETAREHVDLFRRVASWNANTRDRMFAIGVADMIFVQRNPDYFSTVQYALCEVVWGAASQERRDEFLEVNQPITQLVIGIVDDAVAKGDLQLVGFTPQQLTVGLWALCLGMHNLVHAEGVLRDFDINQPYRAMCRHMQYMLNGFGWKPLSDPADEAATERLIQRIKSEVFHDLA
ncbi:MAG TPA: TetR/AcrR family transcriptional regulator [Nevskiaceae bacterium]|nr:TetR/AcrR family transcriptional regulator [Nevskiaceae bacterium]